MLRIGYRGIFKQGLNSRNKFGLIPEDEAPAFLFSHRAPGQLVVHAGVHVGQEERGQAHAPHLVEGVVPARLHSGIEGLQVQRVRDSLNRQNKSGWSINVTNPKHPRRLVLVDTRFVDAEIM